MQPVIPIFERSVLLIEHNPNDSEIFNRIFKRLYPLRRLMVAATGSDALDCLHSFKKDDSPQLVLSVLKLGAEVSAVQLLQEIRSMPIMLCIPFVVFAGSICPCEVDDVLKAGANAVVSKPADVEDYEQCVTDITDFWLVRNIRTRSI